MKCKFYENVRLLAYEKNRNVWILLTGEFVAGFGLWLGIIGDLEFMQDKVSSDFLKSLILVAGILQELSLVHLRERLQTNTTRKLSCFTLV